MNDKEGAELGHKSRKAKIAADELRALYAAGVKNTALLHAAALLDDIRADYFKADVIAVLLRKSPRTSKEISEIMGWSRNEVAEAVSILKKDGRAYVGSWNPPPGRGQWVAVYHYGFGTDVPMVDYAQSQRTDAGEECERLIRRFKMRKELAGHLRILYWELNVEGKAMSTKQLTKLMGVDGRNARRTMTRFRTYGLIHVGHLHVIAGESRVQIAEPFYKWGKEPENWTPPAVLTRKKPPKVNPDPLIQALFKNRSAMAK